MNALIVIDMQEAYFKTPQLTNKKQSLVREINRLIADFSTNGDLIVNVRTVHSTDKSTWTLNMLEDDQGFAFEDTDEALSVDGLQLAGAIEVAKTRDSAFHDTQLDDLLKHRGVSAITLAGVSTHSCIFQTASDAYALGFQATIPRAAVADEDTELEQQALRYLHREYRQEIR